MLPLVRQVKLSAGIMDNTPVDMVLHTEQQGNHKPPSKMVWVQTVGPWGCKNRIYVENTWNSSPLQAFSQEFEWGSASDCRGQITWLPEVVGRDVSLQSHITRESLELCDFS